MASAANDREKALDAALAQIEQQHGADPGRRTGLGGEASLGQEVGG